MGLASSQARLLNLTSRMHQIEYKAAKLENEKLQMANASRRAYLEYQEATEKTKIQIKSLLTNAAATYVDIKSYEDMLNAGFGFCVHGVPVNDQGEICDKNQATGEKDIVCDSADRLQEALGKKYNTTITLPTNATEFRAALSNIVTLGDVTIVQHKIEEGVDKGFIYDSSDPEFDKWQSSVATNTSFQEVEDTAGLRKAEAKYEADMRRIDMKDRKFDYDLQALEAERNAIKQEMETLKTVAKDNVERTFKLFS